MVLGKEADGAGGDQHAELRKQVLELRDSQDKNQWALAAALVTVHRGGCYNEWGHSSWREYVEKELDFDMRKAQQLVKTEEWLTTLKPNVQAFFRSLTYTKARMLTNIVTNENAAEWRVKIEGKTVMQIDKILHDDAVEKGADPDGKGADAGPERQPPFRCALSPAQRANVMRALEACAKVVGCDTTKDRLGYLLDLICTEYLATNGGLQTVQEYLANVESVIGFGLVAYDVGNDAVAYGGPLLDKLFGAGSDGEKDEDADADADEDAAEVAQH